jgi:benzoyl-CoA reductase/2-hydroxyglutaryl-CoA dehydratase subunit BcrC/BadD/HgdB
MRNANSQLNRRVVYSSHFVPAELLAAHGLRPHRLFSATRATPLLAGANEGLCPYATAFVKEAGEFLAVGEAVIVTTTCDQMRRAAEFLGAQSGNVFLMNVPATWQTATAQRMYRDELARLSRFLVRFGGVQPEDARLAEIMETYEQQRTALRAGREKMKAREFAEAVIALHQSESSADVGLPAQNTYDASGPMVARSTQSPPRIRLALVGGPLPREHFQLYELLEESGARIVLDATETGERTLPAPFDRAHLQSKPLEELARAYFQIPDAFHRPDTELHLWLKRELAARKAQCVLFFHHNWCDLWHAELQRLKETFSMPVIELEPNGADGQSPRTLSRIQALLEMFA